MMFKANFIPFLLLSIVSFSTSSHAQDAYGEGLILKAKQFGTAESKAWRHLLHFESGPLSWTEKSTVDAPEFFLSKDGKVDPSAELIATVRGIFNSEGRPEGKEIRCAFPARYHFLKNELQIDEAKVPFANCSEFEEWKQTLNVDSITLVYPSAYLNSPASMFGHTLLRLDAKGQSEETRLLAYGSSYAAATTETSGLTFAFRGIFGMYKGVFSVQPYYKLVRDYSDIENRDIWEYQLNLSSEEVEQVVRHLWEVGTHWFEYYFFDENCSYQLLALLEGAVPRLQLIEHFPLWVIPPETIRMLMAEPGLIRGIHYRAAKSTLVREEERHLPEKQRIMAQKLALSQLEVSSVSELQPLESRAKVLELAYDYLEYLQNTGRKAGEGAGERARELLLARNALGSSVPSTKVTAPTVRPEEGHRSGKLSLSTGGDESGPYSELRVRPAFHELLDPEPGYSRGAELRFFDTKLRWNSDRGASLESFVPLAIQSLSARSTLFHPVSWKVTLATDRFRRRDRNKDFLSTHLDVGAGLTNELAANGLVYGFLTGTLRQSNELAGNIGGALGPELGAFYDLGEDLRIKGDGLYRLSGSDSRDHDAKLSLQSRYVLGKQLMLNGEVSRTAQLGRYSNQAEIGISYFF